ncbi:hypothetical protein Tco_0333292 [Tanacetum coccineum]
MRRRPKPNAPLVHLLNHTHPRCWRGCGDGGGDGVVTIMRIMGVVERAAVVVAEMVRWGKQERGGCRARGWGQGLIVVLSLDEAWCEVISRDDLTELYRIVMNRYGMDGPEDELEKVFWKYLKNMFEEPLSTDPIWSELGQQRIISWRYYESCRVHCLNLESMDIYMLIERTYPLSAEMCKAMLDKKLQGGKPDENCYKMLKMMEKQAGIRK